MSRKKLTGLINKGLGERLKAVRHELGLKQREFAERIFITGAYLSQIERGLRMPSDLVLSSIEAVCNVRKEWLLTGEGPRRSLDTFERMLQMAALHTEEEHAEMVQLLLKSRLFDTFLEEMKAGRLISPKGAPELKVVSHRELDELEEREAFVPVPLVAGAAAAGDPRAISDHDIESYCLIYQSWCKRPEDYVCVRLTGDSMAPALPDGSIVAIHLRSRSPRALNKKLVAARHEGGVAVKELQRSGEHWFLISYNKEYPPLLIEPGEEENPIIGKVAWWWARQE